MNGLKRYKYWKNVGLQPLYNVNKYNVKKYTNGKNKDDNTS